MALAPEERRYEIKFAIHPLQLAQVRAAIAVHPAGFRRAYPSRRVNNIYFDTVGLSDYNANRDGLGERKKVRVRWYGAGEIRAAAYEIKIRRGGFNHKLRHILADGVNLAADRSWTEIVAGIRRGLPLAVEAAAGGAFRPVLVTGYERDYLATVDDEIRLTVDYQQWGFSQLAATRPNLRFPLPPPHAVVVELKGPVAAEDQLMAISSSLPIRVSRNSKYAITLERALNV